jgi:predicted pyridoxine 5'-phosphate oxidase superfamily flavin-nucleotide-binding protein
MYILIRRIFQDTLQAHQNQLNKFLLFEDVGLLITASKDGTVKFWQYLYFTHRVIDEELKPFKNEQN